MHPSLKHKFHSFLKSFAEKDMRGSVKNVSNNRCDTGDDSETDKERFKGCDVKKIRKIYNISQRCFAAMLDISIKTLQNYEIDRRTIPGTARSLFLFAAENVELFRKYYLQKIDNLEPYRESVNRKQRSQKVSGINKLD